MPMCDWLRQPQRLLTLFLAVIVLPSGALVWLAWRSLQQDRALESQRIRERLEDAATSVVAGLEQRLEELSRQLSGLQVLPNSPAPDILAVTITDSDIAAQPAGRLLYYPLVSSLPPLPQPQLGKAETLEYKQDDYAAAAGAFRRLAQSEDPAVRAAALLGWGRCLRKSGRNREALPIYAELARMGTHPVNGDPAELVGRMARCSLLAELKSSEMQKEAAELYQDLQHARWRLNRASYEFYAAQISVLLPQDTLTVPDPDILALADAVAEAAALRESLDRKNARGRKTAWLRDRPVLILWDNSAQRMTALIAGARYFSGWSDLWKDRNVQAALTDSDSHLVFGNALQAGATQVVRTAAETGLPWTLRVASADPGAESAMLAGRRRVMIAGLTVILILVLAGGYLVARARASEIAVARLQTDFVAAVSHEFRSPLTSMRHLIEMLEQGAVPNDAKRRRYYQVLGQETRRLHRLVEHLLNFGRMEAGKAEFRFEPVQVGSLVQSVAADFRGELASPDRLEVAIETPEAVIDADREALARAVWNLLDNAVKYSGDGEPIKLDAFAKDAEIGIRIRDQGPGIPLEDQKEIFRKFYRGAAAQNSGVKGTGLGLATVRYIVLAHKGEIRLESSPGKGSIFTILLPRADRRHESADWSDSQGVAKKQ